MMLTKEETITLVKTHLSISTNTRDQLISDIWQNAVNYLNTKGLPEELEPMVRTKVKGIIDYETQFGDGNVIDVTSQTEGKCSWTYALTADSSRNGIYNFNTSDFNQLNLFRKVRW
jgi:hypothetical protein